MKHRTSRPQIGRVVAAIVLLLALVVVPHHHHEGGAACFAVEVCHSDGVPNDEHTGHREHGQQPFDHIHYLRPLVVKALTASAGPVWLPVSALSGEGVSIPRPSEIMLGGKVAAKPERAPACPANRHIRRRGPPVC